jgi:hypothetical protein
MDPMAQAFAYYDYDETAAIALFAGVVAAEVLPQQGHVPGGFSTPTTTGTTTGAAVATRCSAGTRLPGSGTGAKSLGRELARTDAFARCQVQKVFKDVCFRRPSDAQDRAKVDAMTTRSSRTATS